MGPDYRGSPHLARLVRTTESLPARVGAPASALVIKNPNRFDYFYIWCLAVWWWFATTEGRWNSASKIRNSSRQSMFISVFTICNNSFQYLCFRTISSISLLYSGTPQNELMWRNLLSKLYVLLGLPLIVSCVGNRSIIIHWTGVTVSQLIIG